MSLKAQANVSGQTIDSPTFTGTTTATGPFRQADGSIGAPSYSFTSTTTTGMFVASGQLVLCMGGTTGYQIVSASNQQLKIGTTMASVRLSYAQGAAVASAAQLTLGTDGNYFQITGTTGITLLDNTGWQGGSVVTLKFNASLSVSHNTAASGNFKPILLAGAAAFSATANDTLTLRYDSTDAAWYEMSRAVI